MVNDTSFYMVFVENAGSPTYKHDCIETAEAEAKRLAKLTGYKAYVLCSLKSFRIREFEVQDLRPDYDLPF